MEGGKCRYSPHQPSTYLEQVNLQLEELTHAKLCTHQQKAGAIARLKITFTQMWMGTPRTGNLRYVWMTKRDKSAVWGE